MKKILTALAIASLAVSPAMAHERDHEHHHGGGNKWIAPLLGGLILGAIITKKSDDEERLEQQQRDRYYQTQPTYTYEYVPTCWYEERTDYYGYTRVYRVCR